ncbi:uromodulin-like [Salmo trutta]|uniref:uromodulin-like n=1 Tax=Salmo trutta TaxID=8032 RepID=UPI001131C649|nr:uromodulin-like [Salmo trutta]
MMGLLVMTSEALLLLLFIQASTGDRSGTVVTSCETCDDQATCLVSSVELERVDAFPTRSFTCTCQDGFVGNGITCYDPKICESGSCCHQGYRWSSILGCVDVDECSLPDQPCAPQVCENTPGSFNCLVPSDDNLRSVQHTSPNVDLHSVQFMCGDTECPVGQDCISIGGTSRCADPCQHYSVLNDTWRATNYRGIGNCDKDINFRGWYRMFLGDTSVQMPERCVQKHTCGTNSPMWLTDPHPQLSDGVVQRGICGSYDSCCQYKQTPIHVKACYRNYYVYKFVSPTYCTFAYCADVNTMVCATCRNDQTCVSEDKINWRCERKAPELVCGRSVLQVGLSRAHLEGAGLNATTAHLADRRCSAHEDRNGMVWYQVERREGHCGNTVKTNGTHAVYSNSILVYPVDARNDSPLSFPFSCIYPLEIESSLDVPIRPHLPTDNAVVAVGAKARASMFLYRNSNYTEPYPAGQAVTLLVGSSLHVGVSVDESDPELFVVVLDDCFTTESPSPDNLLRYYIIQDSCPSNRTHVTVEESASSLQARFSAVLYGGYRYVFLHCRLSLCNHRSSPCSPVCSRRRSRSVAKSVSLNPLTIGPITWAQSLE